MYLKRWTHRMVDVLLGTISVTGPSPYERIHPRPTSGVTQGELGLPLLWRSLFVFMSIIVIVLTQTFILGASAVTWNLNDRIT